MNKTTRTTLLPRLPLPVVLTLIVAGLSLPTPSQGQSRTPAPIKGKPALHKGHAASPAMYECPTCHERVTAAKARSQDMLCACCKDKLVPVKTAGANTK